MISKIKQSIGIALVVAGALMLVASHLLGLNGHNAALFTPLMVIIIGIVTHVAVLKGKSKY